MTLSASDRSILYVKQYHKVESVKRAAKQAKQCFSRGMINDLNLKLSIEQGILDALRKEVYYYV